MVTLILEENAIALMREQLNSAVSLELPYVLCSLAGTQQKIGTFSGNPRYKQDACKQIQDTYPSRKAHSIKAGCYSDEQCEADYEQPDEQAKDKQ